MGTYCYILTTKTRRVDVGDGQKADVNLLKYSHKEFGWRSDEPAWLKAKLARMDYVWSGDREPDYFVIGDDFEDGLEVYTNWGSRGGSITDDQFGNLDFVGILRAKGSRFVLEKWTVIEAKAPTPHAVRGAIQGLTKHKVRVEYKDKKSRPSPGFSGEAQEYVFRVICEHENDAVMAKVALY